MNSKTKFKGRCEFFAYDVLIPESEGFSRTVWTPNTEAHRRKIKTVADSSVASWNSCMNQVIAHSKKTKEMPVKFVFICEAIYAK